MFLAMPPKGSGSSKLIRKLLSSAKPEVLKLYNNIPSLQQHEVLAGFARIVASFKYGHTDIGWRESPVRYHVTPVNFYWFSDGVYAEGVDKKYGNVVGAKLLKVEGMPVADVLNALKPLIPAENNQYFKAYGLDYLLIPEALHAQKICKELKVAVSLHQQNGDSDCPGIMGLSFPEQIGLQSGNNLLRRIT